MDKDDITEVTINLSGVFSATELEEAICDLAAMRADMTPAVPRTLPDTPEVHGVAVESEPLFKIRTLVDGGVRIWLRHAGFGWLGFTLPPADVAGLREFLGKKIGHSHTAH